MSKDQIAEALAEHGRTVGGLRKAQRATILAYTDKHQEVATKAAADGKSLKPKDPGGSDHDPRVAAIRACLGEAFPAASRAGTDLLVVTEGEEADVLQLLSGLGPDVSSSEFAEWLRLNQSTLTEQVSNIATHASRMAHTSTSVALVNADAAQSVPFLCSVTAKGATRMSYFGNSAVMPVVRFLFGTFLYGGSPLSLYSAVVARNQAFLDKSGLPLEFVQELRAAATKPADVTDRIAQIRWPMADGQYVSLSPLPSVAVLDEIAHLHSYEQVKERFLGRFLPLMTMTVGGANPQNAGAFNAANRGTYPLYKSQLFMVSQDTEARIARRLWATNWLNRVASDLAGSMNADLSRFDNPSKDVFLRQHAYVVLRQSLTFAFQANAYLFQLDEDLPEGLATRLSRNPVAQWLVDPKSAELAEPVAGAVLGRCVEAGATSLRSDEDKRNRFFNSLCFLLTHEFAEGAL